MAADPDLYEQEEGPTPDELEFDTAEFEAGEEEGEELAGLEDEDDLGVELEDEEELEGEEDPMDELTQDLAAAIGDFLRDKIDDGTLEITTGEDADEIDLEGAAEEEDWDEDEDEDEEDWGEEEDEGLEDEDELEEAIDGWGGNAHDYKRHNVGGVEKKTGDVGGHYKDYEKQEESLVAEVARRVARRILTSRRR